MSERERLFGEPARAPALAAAVLAVFAGCTDFVAPEPEPPAAAPGPRVPEPFPDARHVRAWLRASGLVLGPGELFQQVVRFDEQPPTGRDVTLECPPAYTIHFCPPDFRRAWWSSDPAVLEVDSTGMMRAVRRGVAAVWVQVESARDSSLVRVSGLGDPVGPRYRSIAAGPTHTCALAEDGRAYCWGTDSRGELGQGRFRAYASTKFAAPLPVVGGHTFRSLALGGDHTCGLEAGGNAWCWGDNWLGQLGTGESGYDQHQASLPVVFGHPTPLRVVGGIAFDTIAAAWSTNCGLSEGTAYCWGAGWSSGWGSWGDRARPTPVVGGHRFRLLGAGISHFCALTLDDETYCWGDHNGAAPADPESMSFEPVRVATGLPFVQLVGGHGYTCGLTRAWETYCWGENKKGQLGHDDLSGSRTPRRLEGFEFVALTAGREHTCGLTAAGEAYCWGTNADAQLGRGDRNFHANPEPRLVRRVGVPPFAQLSASEQHTCALGVDRLAYCWGSWNYSGLGIGSVPPSERGTPVVALPTRVVAPIP